MELTATMTLIGTILIVMILAGFNALLSYFLDYCFWENSIFGKWLPFVAKLNLKFWNPKKYKDLEVLKEHKDFDNMLIDSAQLLPFYKILGGCIICTNIYIAFITFTFISLVLLPISFWFVIPYALFSSFILRRIIK